MTIVHDILSGVRSRARAVRIEGEAKMVDAKSREQLARARASAAQSLANEVAGSAARLEAGASREMGGTLTAAAGGVATVKNIGDYDSWQRTRLNVKKAIRPGNANSHLDWQTRTGMRTACESLRRNNPVARAIAKRKAQLVVGDGFTVKATTADTEWNANATAMFADWAETAELCDHRQKRTFWQILAGVVRSFLFEGDVTMLKLADGRLQIFEAERLVNPGLAIDVPTCIGGIELENDRPKNFCFGTYSTNGYYITGDVVKRDARDVIFLTNVEDEAHNQVRGEPGFQASMNKLEQVAEFEQKTTIAAIMATLFGLAIKTNDPAGMQAAMEAATDNQAETNSAKPAEIELKPGGIVHLSPGESIDQIKPEYPTTNAPEFIQHLIMQVCADVGCPFVLTHFNLRGMTASNVTTLLALSYRAMETEQRHLIDNCVRRVYVWKIGQWIEDGLLPMNAEWTRHTVIPPSQPLAERMSELQASAFAINNNLSTLEAETERLGTGDANTNMAKRAKEVALQRELGIEPVQLPGAKAGNGGGEDNAAAKGDAADEAPEETDGDAAVNTGQKSISPK